MDERRQDESHQLTINPSRRDGFERVPKDDSSGEPGRAHRAAAHEVPWLAALVEDPSRIDGPCYPECETDPASCACKLDEADAEFLGA